MVKAAQRQPITIHLGGKLGQLFGKIWKLAVSSPAEAFFAINANTKGEFRRYLTTQGKAKYYKVAVGNKKNLLDGGELANRSGTGDIYFWPTVKGSGATARIIIGVVIIAVVSYFTLGAGSAASSAFFTAPTAAAGGAAATAGSLTFLGSLSLSIGMSLVLGGISQLLAPNPNDRGGQLNSNVFQGSIGGAQQGGCVPVVYGRALVAPTPISIWFANVDYSTTQNAYVNAVQLLQLPGGGYEYVSVTPIANDPGNFND